MYVTSISCNMKQINIWMLAAILLFSGLTTLLHGLWNRADVMSMHGTMSSFLAKGGTDATSTLMRDLLMGQVPRYELPAHKQNITVANTPAAIRMRMAGKRE